MPNLTEEISEQWRSRPSDKEGAQLSRPRDKGVSGLQKKIFRPFLASEWSKNKEGEGGQGPRAPPPDPPLQKKRLHGVPVWLTFPTKISLV